MKMAVGKKRSFLMLGPETGWHADQIRQAAARFGCHVTIAPYESLAVGGSPNETSSLGRPTGSVQSNECPDDESDRDRASCKLVSSEGALTDFDGILTRTMPAGSLEQITFRLAMLHAIADGIESRRVPIINTPRSLEWAIDKFATIRRLAEAGLPTPPTRFAQSRVEAMRAFETLGGDCVVKPMLGGEGRGVMRVCDRQLAWYTFSTLEQLRSVIQIQQFIAPGGRDVRMLVVGERVFGVRRENTRSFRTNLADGARTRRIDLEPTQCHDALRVAKRFGLSFAAIDVIDNDNGPPLYLEVNAIPGWKGAQRVIEESIADCLIDCMIQQCEVFGE